MNSLDYAGPGMVALCRRRRHRCAFVVDVLLFRQTHRRIVVLRARGGLSSENSSRQRHTESLAYFKDKPPHVGWEFVFVLSTIVGGAIAAITGGEFANEWLPPMWEARFGDSIALRAAVAFGGGILMAFGARLAGGCTSGHGISGTMQLSVASWIAVICFFIGGIAVAIPLFKM